jgi:hypothetical protein
MPIVRDLFSSVEPAFSSPRLRASVVKIDFSKEIFTPQTH